MILSRQTRIQNVLHELNLNLDLNIFSEKLS
jgi:hypothetical protein